MLQRWAHDTLHANHWHHFNEIWWPIGVKMNHTTFNEIQRFIAKMTHDGRIAFITFKYPQNRDFVYWITYFPCSLWGALIVRRQWSSLKCTTLYGQGSSPYDQKLGKNIDFWTSRDICITSRKLHTPVLSTLDWSMEPRSWTPICQSRNKAIEQIHNWAIMLKQDRRWNADKPSAALDPYIPTWLTTSSANHSPANFWKSFFFFFETLEGNCEKWCNLMLNWCGSISNLKLPFSDSWSTNNHRYYLSVYYGNVYIFSQYVTQM